VKHSTSLFVLPGLSPDISMDRWSIDTQRIRLPQTA
jgi:hypothetical protein